jgi:hypothetical protein
LLVASQARPLQQGVVAQDSSYGVQSTGTLQVPPAQVRPAQQSVASWQKLPTASQALQVMPYRQTYPVPASAS